ncbi:hypothetical protein EMCRGX_G019105 [Ephydatia muelleri]
MLCSLSSHNTYNTTTLPVVITGLVPRTTYTFSVTSYTITGPGTLQQFQTSTADIQAVGWVHQSHLLSYLHLGDINNLNPNGVYQFSVVAQVTIMGQLYSGDIPSSGSTITLEGSPSTDAVVAIGGAVGGVAGGATLIIIVAMAIIIVTRRHSKPADKR